MRKLFTIVLIMAAAIALAAGPLSAQSGSTPIDKEKAKQVKEFMSNSKSKPAGDANQAATKPTQPPTKPVVQPPAKPTVQTADKDKATYVGKVSEKMSPARKVCTDKCESSRASCESRCAQGVKTNDIMLKNECLSCRNTIISCLNRCPAK